jgi:putative salt-induced outer membrane protein
MMRCIVRTALAGATRALTLAVLLALAAPALAQQPPPDEPPPRFEASAQFSLLTTTGNTSNRTLGTGGEVAFRPRPWVFTARALYAENEADDLLSARSFASLFRASRSLTERLSAYGGYSYLHDRFAGVDARHTIDGGLSYALLARAPQFLDVDAGVGYEHESRVEEESEELAIFTAGALYRWEFSETSRFREDFRFVQAFEEGSNWKIEQSASLTATLTSMFSLKLSNIVRYVHDPVPGFERTDTITAVALVWSVKRAQP